MDEGDVVPGCAFPHTSGSEADALSGERVHRSGEVVDPETDVVQRRRMDLGGLRDKLCNERAQVNEGIQSP